MTAFSPVAYNARVARPKTKPVRLDARVSQETAVLMQALAERLGRTRTDVVEAGIRCLAEQNGIKPDPTDRAIDGSGEGEGGEGH